MDRKNFLLHCLVQLTPITCKWLGHVHNSFTAFPSSCLAWTAPTTCIGHVHNSFTTLFFSLPFIVYSYNLQTAKARPQFFQPLFFYTPTSCCVMYLYLSTISVSYHDFVLPISECLFRKFFFRSISSFAWLSSSVQTLLPACFIKVCLYLQIMCQITQMNLDKRTEI